MSTRIKFRKLGGRWLPPQNVPAWVLHIVLEDSRSGKTYGMVRDTEASAEERDSLAWEWELLGRIQD